MAEKSMERKNYYDRWLEKEGVGVIKDFYIEDVRKVPLKWWVRKGGYGIYLNLIGTGEVNDAYICEIPSGKSLNPERYLFEEIIYVVSGNGATTVWQDNGKKQTFEWQAGSLFSPPLNTWRQHFSGSGSEPARLFAVTTAPLVLNLFHNFDFVFDHPFSFTDRYDSREDYFSGQGEAYANRVWESNLVSDVKSFPLQESKRGVGARNILLELSDNTLAAHISEFSVGTYKKAHRHGPGAHIIILHGKGYSLMWPEGSPMQRFDWHEGSIVVPPEGWFHQHFNVGHTPSRFLAIRWGSKKYNFLDKTFDVEQVSVKAGGNQIEYEDEDPNVRRMFEEELVKQSISAG